MINSPDSVFNPLVSIPFSQHLSDKWGEKKQAKLESRDLFFYLNQPGNNPELLLQAFGFIKTKLLQVEQNSSYLDIAASDEDKLALLKTPVITPFDLNLGRRENQILLLEQSAAIQLTQPCWLQDIPQTFSTQSPIALQIMSIYSQLSGAGLGVIGLSKSYHSLLVSMGCRTPELHSYSYCEQLSLIPEIIDFSSIQLALSKFPRVFLAEILGFTFAYCQTPSLFEICFPHHQLDAGFFKQRQAVADKQILPLEKCISIYLGLFPEQNEALWLRVQHGFWLYYHQMQQCRKQLQVSFQTPESVSLALAKLMNNKANAAVGHHKNILLDGKSLDSWFSGIEENGTAFLEALKQSKYVDQKTPENSLLLKLFDFQGPMFGVANEKEITIIKNWLKHGFSEQAGIQFIAEKKITTRLDLKQRFQSEKKYSKLNNRGLYFYLVNVDLYPGALPFARRKVKKLLKACCLFNSLPFKHYSHQQFDRYINDIYQHEMQAYEPLKGPPTVSKSAYLWGLEQIAPMILIDGCWLQKSLDLQQIYPNISEILFSIYTDELGNGLLEQNHPYIFQQLLDNLSIQVPEVYKKEFGEHSGFINSAFDLPVYMLSLANHSVEFLPELLGLNMAIELSGLGKHYMRLVDDWNYWGIDPTIANIHISIDNIASGHTFLAKKAIQDYMSEVLNKTASHEIVDQHWRRIYTGFSSLRFVAGRFKLYVPMVYFINKFTQKPV